MHVITRRTLKNAARRYNDVHLPLEAWYRIVKKADWSTFADVRKLWSSADVFGECTIFNIKGNKYRLVVWINYRKKRVFIRHVMTHSEYSKGAWKNDCISQ
jgi:mRNA interferase HigB